MGPIKLKFRAPYAKKVHQIEKNTTSPVEAVVANTSYVLTNLSFFVFGIVILINLFFCLCRCHLGQFIIFVFVIVILSLSLLFWPTYHFIIVIIKLIFFIVVIIIATDLFIIALVITLYVLQTFFASSPIFPA